MLPEMNRRNFLRTMVGGVAVAAAVRTWPFRVYSFPDQVQPIDFVKTQLAEAMRQYKNSLDAAMYMDGEPMEFYFHPEQAHAFLEMAHKPMCSYAVVTKVDQRKKEITLSL